jgi:hypothetical protein
MSSEVVMVDKTNKSWYGTKFKIFVLQWHYMPVSETSGQSMLISCTSIHFSMFFYFVDSRVTYSELEGYRVPTVW